MANPQTTVSETVNLLRDRIRAGGYSCIYQFKVEGYVFDAVLPWEPKLECPAQLIHGRVDGQQSDQVDSEPELYQPDQDINLWQVIGRAGNKMASLLDLLDYGIKNPNAHLEGSIGIVWKVGDWFWRAWIGTYGMERGLFVTYTDGGATLYQDERLLVLK